MYAPAPHAPSPALTRRAASMLSLFVSSACNPLIDASKGAWQYVESLSKEDFPESALIFNEKQCVISKVP